MLKKMLYSFLISVSILLCATATVNAEQMTKLPIYMRQTDASFPNGTYSISLNVFDINKVYAISSTQNRIEFNIGYWDHSGKDGYKQIQFNCYDINGYFIEKHLYKDCLSNVLDISNRTATIEVTVSHPHNSYRWNVFNDSYIYRKPVTVYAADGRSMVITDLLVPTYEAVGWYPMVTVYSIDGRSEFIHVSKVEAYKQVGWYEDPVIMMYSLDNRSKVVLRSKMEANMKVGWYTAPVVKVYTLDGREDVIVQSDLQYYVGAGWYTEKPVELYALDGRMIRVPQADMAAYLSVGWYTLDGLKYQKFINQINQYKASGNYNEIFNYIDENAEQLKNTQYAQEVYVLRTQAMDWWRVAIGRPMGVIEYQTGKNSADVPTATITFRNVSYKKILAFKLKFTCYNIFGEVEETYYSYYFDDNANIKSGDTYQTTWTLHGADSVYSLSGIKVTEVVFEDGTKWTGN